MHDSRPEGSNPSSKNNSLGNSNQNLRKATVKDISPATLASKALQAISDPENPSDKISIKDLPTWAKNQLHQALLAGLEDWQVEGFNEIGLKVSILAAHEVDHGYFRVVAGLQSGEQFLTPASTDCLNSFEKPTIPLNDLFSGFIVDIWYIEGDDPEIATNPLLAPKLLRREIDRFFDGDISGILGVELSSRLVTSLQEKVSIESIRSKTLNLIEEQEVYNFIVELSNGSSVVVEWMIQDDLVGRLNYFEIFPKDQIAIIEDGIVEESGEGQDVSALAGIDEELSGAGYSPIDPKIFGEFSINIINNINTACLIEFPYLKGRQDISYQILEAWESSDKKELQIFVAVLDEEGESLVPNFNGNFGDKLQETGVLCKLSCPTNMRKSPPIDCWEVFIDGIGLCEYRLKAELEAIISPKPDESGLFHYLKEIVAGGLGLVGEECPTIKKISLNTRDKIDTNIESAPFVLLCETDTGSALVKLNTQYNCALLPIDEVFILHAWLPDGPKVSCRNQPDLDPAD